MQTFLEYSGTGFGSEQLSVDAVTAEGFSVSELTATIGEVNSDGGSVVRANFATIYTDAALRVKWDGTDPTTSAGIYLAANSVFRISGPENIENFRMISVSGSANVDVMYEY